MTVEIIGTIANERRLRLRRTTLWGTGNMQRLFAYAITAILTFLLGVVVFQAALTIDSLEGRFRRWLETPPTLEASADVPLTDEQADANQVYRAIIQERFLRERTKFLFINAQTTGCDFFENDEDAAQYGVNGDFVTRVKAIMPEADSSAIDDYFSKNRVPDDLLVSDLGIDYRLGTGWFGPDAHERVPEASEIIFLSKVGFNPQRDRAFVYLGYYCGGLCGSGGYLFLKKDATGWKTQTSRGLWVS